MQSLRDVNWFKAVRYAVAGTMGFVIGYTVGWLLNIVAIGMSLVIGKIATVVIMLPLAMIVGYFDAKYTWILADRVDTALTRWYKNWMESRKPVYLRKVEVCHVA